MSARGRVASLIVAFGLMWVTRCAPPTCYSRTLELSGEITRILDKLHNSSRTRACAELLPRMFLDVHNSCIRSKLRDSQYLLENIPRHCADLPRVRGLKRRVSMLHSIITRACYRDMVFYTDDCEALETGNVSPRYTEDRLEQLMEDD